MLTIIGFHPQSALVVPSGGERQPESEVQRAVIPADFDSCHATAHLLKRRLIRHLVKTAGLADAICRRPIAVCFDPGRTAETGGLGARSIHYESP